MQQITFKERSVYGRILTYPDCEKSKIFAKLLSTKTFNQDQLDTIASLGYKVNLITL